MPKAFYAFFYCISLRKKYGGGRVTLQGSSFKGLRLIATNIAILKVGRAVTVRRNQEKKRKISTKSEAKKFRAITL